ncbi:IclR family transcriptional regulator [Nocardioides sp. OK12]|uniref:Glycerol operon regulatory protein n=1 Tax=Nocardioides marinisabuli TaxID=419476 RepID=A0A7Y9JQY1_9ACTN|nr:MULTISPECIES: IclR family transcriptional regulator [Nocardioides]NYD57910.1 DNA-binding IclR family transcriptional regulator [Nocardioides marinisabuli]GHJ57585.1 IclR family transcriptional regulator [Nocardioides sp. OK12]
MSDEIDGFQPVKSADRTLAVLEALADARQPPSLGDLSRDLGIPKSSLHGILRTLTQRNWVVSDATGTRFSLGLRALRVGSSFVDTDDMVTRTARTLDWISAEIGEATHLGRLDGSDVVYLAKRDSTHPVRLYSAIGRRLPAHATGLGKAVLATYTDEAVLAMLPEELVALTDHTVTDHDALLAELARVRRDGYATDNEENSAGIRCFAAALPPASPGPATDAISISIPMFRLDAALEARAIELVLEVHSRVLAGV